MAGEQKEVKMDMLEIYKIRRHLMLPKNETIYIGRKKPRKKCKSGWRRELGTSKKVQGIVTPKAPRNRRNKPKTSAAKSFLDIFKKLGSRTQ
jgi:hypothetical protein